MSFYRILLKVEKNIICKHLQYLPTLHHSANCKASQFPKYQSATTTQWKPIYVFPMIRAAKFFNRFKLYQTLLTVAAIPTASILFCYDILDFRQLELVLGLGSFACFTLYPMTWYFRRIIGFIYMSEDGKSVKVAHLTFWGSRRDVIIPVKNIIPLTDFEYNPNDIYVKLKQYNSESELHFTLKYGKILDRKKFETVFGDLNLLQITKK